MPSQSHGRRCLVLAVLVGVLVLLVKIQYDGSSNGTSGAFDILRQYSSSKTTARGTGNNTLGVRVLYWNRARRLFLCLTLKVVANVQVVREDLRHQCTLADGS